MPVTITPERFGTTHVRVVQGTVARPAPLVLHLPSGSFLGTAAERPVATVLAEAGAVVVSADYPAGTRHPFPEALEAMHALLTDLDQRRGFWGARGSPLFVAGEEAGGNLAAALTLVARDRLGPKLAGQILLSPMLDAEMATCSFRDADAGPVGCKWADGWASYLSSACDAAHPYAVPAYGTRMAGLPPALIVTTPDDPMRDEALAYAGRLYHAGVAVQVRAIGARDWPDALSRPLDPGSDWADTVRDNARIFFAAAVPGLVPAAEFGGASR